MKTTHGIWHFCDALGKAVENIYTENQGQILLVLSFMIFLDIVYSLLCSDLQLFLLLFCVPLFSSYKVSYNWFPKVTILF